MTPQEQAAFTAMQEAYANAWMESFTAANPFHTVFMDAEDLTHIDAGLRAAISAAKAVSEKGAHHMSTPEQPQLKEQIRDSRYIMSEQQSKEAIAKIRETEPQANDLLQDVASCIGVGGYNGATPQQLTDRIRAEFDRLQQKVRQVQPGWKLVPVEPTQEMMGHGAGAGGERLNMSMSDAAEIYRAMLAAAPITDTSKDQANG